MFRSMSDELYVYACALPSNPLIQNAGTTVKARRTKIHIARPPATPMYTKEMNELARSKKHVGSHHNTTSAASLFRIFGGILYSDRWLRTW